MAEHSHHKTFLTQRVISETESHIAKALNLTVSNYMQMENFYPYCKNHKQGTTNKHVITK